jgi:pyridoxine/pyridoxamine 5'-phosphate oxidase
VTVLATVRDCEKTPPKRRAVVWRALLASGVVFLTTMDRKIGRKSEFMLVLDEDRC